jgi:hypothetical protein
LSAAFDLAQISPDTKHSLSLAGCSNCCNKHKDCDLVIVAEDDGYQINSNGQNTKKISQVELCETIKNILENYEPNVNEGETMNNLAEQARVDEASDKALDDLLIDDLDKDSVKSNVDLDPKDLISEPKEMEKDIPIEAASREVDVLEGASSLEETSSLEDDLESQIDDAIKTEETMQVANKEADELDTERSETIKMVEDSIKHLDLMLENVEKTVKPELVEKIPTIQENISYIVDELKSLDLIDSKIRCDFISGKKISVDVTKFSNSKNLNIANHSIYINHEEGGITASVDGIEIFFPGATKAAA